MKINNFLDEVFAKEVLNQAASPAKMLTWLSTTDRKTGLYMQELKQIIESFGITNKATIKAELHRVSV